MDRVTVKDPPLVHSRAGTRRAGVTVTATARSPERGTRGSRRHTRLRTDGTAPGAQESNGSGGGSTKPSAATQALKPSERTTIVKPNFQILLQLAVTSEAAGCLCTPRTLYFIKRNLLQHFGQELQEIINKFLTSKGSF